MTITFKRKLELKKISTYLLDTLSNTTNYLKYKLFGSFSGEPENKTNKKFKKMIKQK
jgi:hypothetical protein